jgi:very-short-patch-repair endonuclease
MRKFWSEEEIEFLKELYIKDGLSISELYPIFKNTYDRSLDGVNVKIGKLKLKHTKEQISNIKSRLNSGEGNGMFGKASPMKGLTKDNSEIVRNKSIRMSETRKNMFENGFLSHKLDKNPFFGLLAWNNGLTKDTDERVRGYGLNISIIQKKLWLEKTEEEKNKIILRLNDAMIQSKSSTKIEVKVGDFLNSLNVEYNKNYRIGKFLVDFYLPSINLVIECDGDYWHANPKIYKCKILTDAQIKNIDRDIRKNKMLSENKIECIRFWESDIKNNFELIKTEICVRLQKK